MNLKPTKKMDILSKDHLLIIRKINSITDTGVYYGGSIEDYLLLGDIGRPIGDIDVIVYDKLFLNLLINNFNIINVTDSYYNRLMSQKFTKYVTEYLGIKIDIFYSLEKPPIEKFTTTILNGLKIPHRCLEYKVEIIREWITKSIPNDMWAHDKFTKLLIKYENINNQ